VANIHAFVNAINLIHRDATATVETLAATYSEAFEHFANNNNRDGLNNAVAKLGKTKTDAAILTAISEGYKASGLTVGRIGAVDGPWAKLAPEQQQPWIDATEKAKEAFKLSIVASNVFADKVAKTDEEKAKAKEAKEAMITAMIQSGEIVRSSDIRPFPQEEIDALKLAVATLTAENAKLTADNATLENAVATITTDYDYASAQNERLAADIATLTTAAAKKAKVARVA
jgi:hypothetical protein